MAANQPGPEQQLAGSAQPQRVKWKTTQVLVQAGTVKQVPLEVKPGNFVEWGFKTEGGDIGFAVMLERPDEEVVTVVPDEKVPAHQMSIQGSAVINEAGRLWLQWDNGYSWLTNKDLTYSISLSEQRPSADRQALPNGNAADAGNSTTAGPPKVIFVLGPPGSGKGTQCALLEEEFGFLHLSAGDLLRAERKNPESKDGALIDAYIRDGKIVPIEITVKLLQNAMAATPSPGYLIDGFPRNQDNLEGWVRETGAAVDVVGVLFFECPEDVAVQRCLERGQTSGRTDDNPESIKKRLVTYGKDTMPIVEYFKAQGKVCNVNTDRAVADILSDLRGIVQVLVFDKPNASSSAPAAVPASAAGAAPVSPAANGSHHDQAAAAAAVTNANGAAEALSGMNGAEAAHDAKLVKRTKPAMRLVLGTMTMAGQTDASTSAEMFDRFVNAPAVRAHLTAGRFEIDTARMYQHGETEALLGRLLDLKPQLKKSLFVATKVNPFKGYGETLQPESVVAQFEASLSDLGMASVDVLYLHAPDHNTKLEATLGAVQELYERGMFRELGLSNYSAWQVMQVYHMCKERGYVLPTLYQGMYNAITRDVERELLPALRALGMRFYAYNPLAGGFLTGKHRSIVDAPRDGRFGEKSGTGTMYRDRFWKPEYFDALDLINRVCESVGVSPTAASIRWLLHHSAMQSGLNDAIILGASKLSHLEENLAAADDGPLPSALVEAMDNAWRICKPSCPPYSR